VEKAALDRRRAERGTRGALAFGFGSPRERPDRGSFASVECSRSRSRTREAPRYRDSACRRSSSGSSPPPPSTGSCSRSSSSSRSRSSARAGPRSVREEGPREGLPRGPRRSLLAGTKLDDVALRKKLWEGGAKAWDASDDPMIRLVRLVDPTAAPSARLRGTRSTRRSGRTPSWSRRPSSPRPERAPYPTPPSPRLTYGSVRGWVRTGRRCLPSRRSRHLRTSHREDPFACRRAGSKRRRS